MLANLWPIVRLALLYGVVLSAVLFPLVLALLRFNPEIMLKDYPPDVRAKHGPMSERSRRQRIPVGIFFTVVLLAIVAVSLVQLRKEVGGDIGLVAAFVHLFTMFSVFNVLDWLVLDWVMVLLQPSFVVLPGTEGMAGYRSYWFHFRGFLIGVPLTLAASLILAPIAAGAF
ncbi:MAG TPA: hypothetical protein VE078_18020 [Thermoanaerobaculia bacterium]|nr:hypothetical protein [Thermoanaerobaculia bacterium]